MRLPTFTALVLALCEPLARGCTLTYSIVDSFNAEVSVVGHDSVLRVSCASEQRQGFVQLFASHRKRDAQPKSEKLRLGAGQKSVRFEDLPAVELLEHELFCKCFSPAAGDEDYEVSDDVKPTYALCPYDACSKCAHYPVCYNVHELDSCKKSLALSTCFLSSVGPAVSSEGRRLRSVCSADGPGGRLRTRATLCEALSDKSRSEDSRPLVEMEAADCSPDLVPSLVPRVTIDGLALDEESVELAATFRVFTSISLDFQLGSGCPFARHPFPTLPSTSCWLDFGNSSSPSEDNSSRGQLSRRLLAKRELGPVGNCTTHRHNLTLGPDERFAGKLTCVLSAIGQEGLSARLYYFLYKPKTCEAKKASSTSEPPRLWPRNVCLLSSDTELDRDEECRSNGPAQPKVHLASWTTLLGVVIALAVLVFSVVLVYSVIQCWRNKKDSGDQNGDFPRSKDEPPITAHPPEIVTVAGQPSNSHAHTPSRITMKF